MPIGLLKDLINDAPQGRALLGLDVGKKTIGLALSDPSQSIATPLETIHRTKFTKDMEVLKAVIMEYEIGGFVVGYPVNMDGSEGPRAQSIRDFAIEMKNTLGDNNGSRFGMNGYPQFRWNTLWTKLWKSEKQKSMQSLPASSISWPRKLFFKARLITFKAKNSRVNM